MSDTIETVDLARIETVDLARIKEVLGEPDGHVHTGWDEEHYFWYVHDYKVTIPTLTNYEQMNLDNLIPIDGYSQIGVEYNGIAGLFDTMEELEYFNEHGKMLKEEDWE